MSSRKQSKYFYLFIAPWIVGFLAFTLYPLIASLFFSFTKYDAVHPATWIGLQNFINLFQDKIFFISIRQTLYYTLVSVPLGLLVSLSFAMLLNSCMRLKGMFRTFLYLPSMVTGVSLSLLWMWILNPQYGVLNYLLSLVGIQGPQWMGSKVWAVPALILMSLWGVGEGMVLFLAALKGVPQSLTEASLLDGAGWWQRFRHVTLPMISPIFLFQLIISLINSFQVFTQAFVMTKDGGPAYATTFYVYYLYKNAFANFKMGYASAMAWLLLLFTMLVALFIIKSSSKMVHYEGGANT
ncbi:MAG: sugar ABC transporter permease [Firmicutes bacterium]|nr:sugar ABC transporter permease [Bacillota bacterium]